MRRTTAGSPGLLQSSGGPSPGVSSTAMRVSEGWAFASAIGVCRSAPGGDEFRRAFFRRSIQPKSHEAATSAAPSGCRSPKLARLEAALFVAPGALPARKLSQLAQLPHAKEVPALLDDLNAHYDAAGTAFRIELVATGYQLLTRPRFASWLDKLHQRQARMKLSTSAMETLVVIAYRQPVTRADVEAVRGVQAAEILKQLMERGLVRITGEEDSLGRPYLYGTTRQFLEMFGLQSLDELPMADSLRRLPQPSQELDGDREHFGGHVVDAAQAGV